MMPIYFKFSVNMMVHLLIILSLLQTPALAIKKAYVVYLGGHSHDEQDLNLAELDQRVSDSHHQLLASLLGSEEQAREAIYYSYNRHINGFAAILDEEDAAQLAKHPDVVSVFLDKRSKLHTTHSWKFLSLEDNIIDIDERKSLWKKARFGEDIIIANLDTGVWPESKSFGDDEDYTPVPANWKGKCQNETIVPCNKKLIGAKYFNKGYRRAVPSLNQSMNSARDYIGHGSHTLSTAAGNFINGSKVFDMVTGTAKGGSPRARVASYKVCWDTCSGSDILKGFDSAIHDGVDVLSVSLGGPQTDYFSDPIAIGGFHAVMKGIVVICSAGNGGPFEKSVTNLAPWLITVAASTTDRDFVSYVMLKNGKYLKGKSLSKPMQDIEFYPLINAADAKAINSSVEKAALCESGTLDPTKVKGKIVVCLMGGATSRTDKSKTAYLTGAVGMILCNNKERGDSTRYEPHILPTSHLTYKDGLVVYAYLNSTKDPMGYLTPPYAETGKKPAPTMTDFSSKGPNRITPTILKPDVTAPGKDIIAAYSEADIPLFDNRTTPYYLLDGTSMSCPHVAGVVGLLKKLHIDWSGAAIRSAIMTTAKTRDNTGKPITDSFKEKATPFSYGAGHIEPNLANDPGLVYDLTVNDYLDFLCGIGYNITVLRTFSQDGQKYKCPKNYDLHSFNYPSITVANLLGTNSSNTVTLTRKVKNVGSPTGVTYAARVRQPRGVSVSVEPSTLTFDKIGEEKSFKLTMVAERSEPSRDEPSFGELIWTDGKHNVKSPIVVLGPMESAAPAA